MAKEIDRLIAVEQEKIRMLQQQISKHQGRIETLNSMKGDDEIDAVLDKRIGAATQSQAALTPTPTVPPVAESKPEEFAYPQKRISRNVRSLLKFVGQGERETNDLVKYANDVNIDLTRQGIRSLMNTYKNKYGIVESPEDGRFRLTERGRQILAAQGETPTAATVGVSDAS